MLWICNFAGTFQEVPSDLKRALYKDLKWFGHTRATLRRPERSSAERWACGLRNLITATVDDQYLPLGTRPASGND